MSNQINSAAETKGQIIRSGKKRSFITLKDNFEFILMVLPGFILMLVFNYLPLIGIIIAFKNYTYDKGIFGSPWVGFKNFEFLFKSQDIWRITRNTVSYSIVFLVLGMAVTVTFALLLFEIKSKLFVKSYQTLNMLPHFLSWVIVSYMAYAFLNPSYGIINQSLQQIGLKPIQWYSNPKLWPPILVFSNLWKHVGYGSIIYFAALMGIDKEYYEAASIDGASKWQMTRYISIPFLVPMMTIITIIRLGNLFENDFGMFYQMTRNIGLLYPTTDIIETYVFRALRVNADITLSSSVGLVQSLVGFFLVVATNQIVRKVEKDNALF